MSITVDFWHLVGLSLAILGSFAGVAKLLLTQAQRHIDEKFSSLVAELSRQAEGGRRIERELLEMKAEVAREYVRRPDHDRVVASLQVSIDNLRLTIERALLVRGDKP